MTLAHYVLLLIFILNHPWMMFEDSLWCICPLTFEQKWQKSWKRREINKWKSSNNLFEFESFPSNKSRDFTNRIFWKIFSFRCKKAHVARKRHACACNVCNQSSTIQSLFGSNPYHPSSTIFVVSLPSISFFQRTKQYWDVGKFLIFCEFLCRSNLMVLPTYLFNFRSWVLKLKLMKHGRDSLLMVLPPVGSLVAMMATSWW